MVYIPRINQSDSEKDSITFRVNEKIQTIRGEYPITTTLNYYLREVLRLTGTKTYCSEGGCGVCVVNAKYFDSTTEKFVNISVNSCLFPLYNCNGYSFTTVEGIGSKSTQLHPIQKRLADRNGSQCGFCSPGFVMTMYSFLQKNPKPTKDQIEKTFDGNICRCTGYRAILDSMKSFAHDEEPIDIEDLKEKLLCLNGSSCGGCSIDKSKESDKCCKKSAVLTVCEKKWLSPSTLSDLDALIKEADFETTRFICANTSTGIFKNQPTSEKYISLKNVKELFHIEKTANCLKVGSSVTITSLIETFISMSSESGFSYLSTLAQSLSKVGNVNVRNVASWSGNLALKKQSDFPSDVLVILEAAGAKLEIQDLSNKSTSSKQWSLDNFLSTPDLKPGWFLIKSMLLPSHDNDKTQIKAYKISPRSQNCHAYINAGFRFNFVNKASTVLNGMPSIVFNGVSDSFFHATQTEAFLHDKDVSQDTVLSQAIETLTNELKSSDICEEPLLPSVDYRISVAVSLFYKFVLLTVSKNETLKQEIKSAIDSIVDCRQVSTASQSVEKEEARLLPVTQPMPKLNSYAQTSGEVKYVDDLSILAHQLNGAFILSQIASAKIKSVNTDVASKMPGVVRIFLARDIPGINSFVPAPFAPEKLFADDEVEYAGQPIGLVVANTREQAKEAARAVQVEYVDVKIPILTIRQAIEQNSFHEKPSCGDLLIGDVSEAIRNAKHQISGEYDFNSSQFNFYLEGIIASCEPTDDGYKVECTTQWLDMVQRSVADVLGLQNSSCIDFQLKQIGGGFGGKATRSNVAATACAVAAHHLRKPIKVHMDLNDCMNMIGKRPPWYVKYRVGFDDSGKLAGLDYDWFSDPGSSSNGSFMSAVVHFFDNVYQCSHYAVRPHLVKTNKPASTEVRSPDVFPSISVSEQVMDHIASYLGRDPVLVRAANFYANGTGVTPTGFALKHYRARELFENVRSSVDYYARKAAIDAFNRSSRYKKRGAALIPMRYLMTHNYGYYNALVGIKHHDGSVVVSHGGIEMGQGIHTKVAQVCALELGVPIEKISIKSTNNLVNTNGLWSGGSVTSELCCNSVIGCCRILNATLEPIRKAMPTADYTWTELIAKAFAENCNLTATFLQRAPEVASEHIYTYDLYGAGYSEVLVDTLTGETQILKTEILYDCGRSLNSLIDVGQAEGAFVMGLGCILLEKSVYDPVSGVCLTNGTWEYKPPTCKDIPANLTVRFAEKSHNEAGVMGTRAVGEPPLLLSQSVLYAIKEAIYAAREDQGVKGHFKFDLPATIDNIQQSCLVNLKSLQIKD